MSFNIHRYPALILAIGFATGIFLYKNSLSIVALPLILIVLFFHRKINIVLVLLSIPIGILHFAVISHKAKNEIELLRGIEGYYILKTEGGSIVRGVSFIHEGEKYPIQGTSYLWKAKDYPRGTKLKVKGRVEGLDKTHSSYAKYLEDLGVKTKIKPEWVSVISYPQGVLYRIYRRLDTKLKVAIKTPIVYAFEKAFLLGDRKDIPDKLLERFKKTGTMHILAISGLHIGLLWSIFFLFLRFIRINLRLSFVLSGLMLYIYLFVVGIRPSILRAVIFATAFIVAEIIERKRIPLNSLGVAGLVSLILNPRWLFNVGFQLSYLATFGILWVFPSLVPYIRKTPKLIKMYILYPLVISISAQLSIVPILVNNFHILSVVSPIANIVLIPLLWLTIAEAGVGLLFSLLSETLSQPFFAVSELSVYLMLKSVEILSRSPYSSLEIDRIPMTWTLFYYLFFLLVPFVLYKLHR